MASDISKRLLQLPLEIQEYIFSEGSGELNDKIITKNGLDEDQLPALFGLLQELFVGDVRPDNLAAEVKKRFGFDDGKASLLAMDIAGYRLLPLDKYLGNIDDTVRLLGGDPKAYPTLRIKIVERTPDEAADEVIHSAGADNFDQRMKERLKDISDSFFRGVRTEKQVFDVLQKPIKTGGLELATDVSSRILDELKEEQRAVHIRDVPTISPPAGPVQEKPPGAPEPPKPKPADFNTITPEDEKEIADLRANIMPAKGAADAAETARKIATTVEALYAASGLQPADEDLQKRLKTIIGNRLRDIRDSMETLEMLVQPKELGGMSLSQDDARKLLSLIEGSLKAVHAAHAEEVRTAKNDWVQAEAEKKSAGEIAGKANDEAELDAIFGQLAAKSKKLQKQPLASLPTVPMPAAASQIVTTAQSPKGAPPVNLPVLGSPAEPAPPRPATAAALPRPAASPLPSPAVPPPTTIVRPVQVPPPAPIPSKPMMQDIVPAAPRLTGPVEALKATTLVDLRRLSKDPKDACAKIRDKIDLLADESYTRRTEGIKAWMESEVYRTYIEMMGEALEGTPMPRVTLARQAANKPYLSQEELQAVSELSRELRY